MRTRTALGAVALAGVALALAACGTAATSSGNPAVSPGTSAAAAPTTTQATTPVVSVSKGSVGWIDGGNVYHPGEPPVGGLDSGADVAAVQATFTNDGSTTVTVTSWDAGFLGRDGIVISTETINVGSTPLASENTTLNPGQSFTDTEGLLDGGPWATSGDRSMATANITVSNVQMSD
jgi:hypothetical protein